MVLSNNVGSRQQDYLVNRGDENQNQETTRSYRLASPSVTVSATGGQAQAPTQERQEPDRSRQKFRARERQIREVRPVDFTLQSLTPTIRNLKADLQGEFQEQSEMLASEAPKTEEFLPDFQKALSGDQGAIQKTGERLAMEYEAPEFAPIRSSVAQPMASFLSDPSQEAFQTELMRSRGGPYGLSALDAARLAASGVGRQAFERGKQELAQAYSIAPELQKRLEQQALEKEQAFATQQELLRNEIQRELDALEAEGQREIEAYKTRDVTDLINEALGAAQAQAAAEPYLQYIGGIDYEPYIDRELTMGEALTPEEIERYNILQELLGGTPLAAMEREAPFSRDALIAALIGEAQASQHAKLSKLRQNQRESVPMSERKFREEVAQPMFETPTGREVRQDPTNLGKIGDLVISEVSKKLPGVGKIANAGKKIGGIF